MATPVPDHLPITDPMKDLARRLGFTGDLTTLTENFLDHHRAKGSRFIDWTAAWRTWLRNEIKFSSTRRPSSQPADPGGHRGARIVRAGGVHA